MGNDAGLYERRKNRNRGYRQLRVWQDAIDFYGAVCAVFRRFQPDLRRVSSQAIASAYSVHRNIAEGYCRRSVKEYLNFLNYALGSLGESVSGFHAYAKAEQLASADYEALDSLAFKIENGLLKLRDSLSRYDADDWSDRRVVRESNAAYDA